MQILSLDKAGQNAVGTRLSFCTSDVSLLKLPTLQFCTIKYFFHATAIMRDNEKIKHKCKIISFAYMLKYTEHFKWAQNAC